MSKAVTTPKRLYLDGSFTNVKALGDGVYEGIVATSSIDRHGEALDINGLDTKAYMSTNPVVLFGHDYSAPESVIGKAITLTKSKTVQKASDGSTIMKLGSQFQLFTDDNPKAALVSKLIKKGVLALSIGFVPKEIEGDTYTKSEMAEFSVVPVPANAEAAITARSLKLTKKEVAAFGLVFKGAISTDLPTADEDTVWDSGAAVKAVKAWASDDQGNIDFKKYRKAFFWVDPANADKQGGYKLPFATIVDGKLVAVWAAVAAVMAVLNGARGGVDIPDADKAAVYTQVKKYYAKFEKDVPDMTKAAKEVVEDEAVDTEDVVTDENNDDVVQEDTEEVETKGAIADELEEDASADEKWDKMQSLRDVYWAFCDVYCDPDTPVDQYDTLLKEFIGILAQILAGTYVDPAADDDDGDDEEVEYSVSQSLKKGVTSERMKELLTIIAKDNGVAPDFLDPQPEKPAPTNVPNPQNPAPGEPANVVKDVKVKGDDNNNDNVWLNVLAAVAQIDKIVDQLQVVMSQALKVPNPDTDEENKAKGAGTGDDDESEAAQSTGHDDQPPKATNTVKQTETIKVTEKLGDAEQTIEIPADGKLDFEKLSEHNIKQLATTFKNLAVALENKVNSLDTTAADTHAIVRKRRIVLAQAKKTAQTGDRMVELILNELKTLQ